MLKRRVLTVLFALPLAAAIAAPAYALSADYPAGKTVSFDRTPAGLEDLVNHKERIHGFMQNAAAQFFYAGDTAAFDAFLKQYADLEGIAGHRLVIHNGKGLAKSPWDKGKGQPCGWMLETERLALEGSHKGIYMDPKPPDSPDSVKAKPRYLVELHVWIDGSVNLEKVKIPDTVKVVREDSAEPKVHGDVKENR